MKDARILIVDDEADIRELLEIALLRMGANTSTARSVSDAYAKLNENEFDLVLTDMKMPGGDGLDIIRHVQTLKNQPPVAMLTAYGNTELAVEALKAGAFDFVSKPIALDKLRSLVEGAVNISKTNLAPKASLIVGESIPVQKLRKQIAKLCNSMAPVYISGESGSGKELVARALHSEGSRAAQPFVPVNCGAIPAELMESEFFGHKKGSFTGAHSDKAGLFLSANGGTLFLDEVADLPLAMQVKLLRAIQERGVRAVGGEVEQAVDVRILCATHKNLVDEVEAGRFRQDLYYRLNVIELPVPPLRERTSDLPMLTNHFLARFAARAECSQPALSESARQTLSHYAFPGNIRELENILERAFTLCEDDKIEAADLGLSANTTQMLDSVDDVDNIDEFLAVMERQVLIRALEKTQGNRTEAAKNLGISFRSIRYRLDRLNINVDEIDAP
ncbi:sigma-54-dependent transcriptional regulator [Umboniibacter marinipuniceus]|uniref:Two-component response regulator PilR n=1 Tax=Umboniibacter marinipuniceus TaxID=569599 RepID=A0A3M0A0V2_9GAMM|nr:sigma-54 dependent transcriptional regulator [Umboniibacter marinipuniceus]RMA78390.1 two-component response regulator PilR [Umboniibacter marinipuniceus]